MIGPDQFHERRAALAARLRVLRLKAEMSGAALGLRAGISQSKISKIELGKLTPSERDVSAIARALGVDAATAGSLEDETRLVGVEWRSRMAAGASLGQSDKRRQYGDLELEAHTVEMFTPFGIPTLLKTPANAEAVRRVNPEWEGRPDGIHVVRMLQRQAQLHNLGKTFRFLVMEFTLECTYGSDDTRQEQLRFLQSFLPRPNVELRVVRHRDPLPHLLYGEFILLDREFVAIELTTGELIVRSSGEAALLVKTFDDFWATSASGDEMMAMLSKALEPPGAPSEVAGAQEVPSEGAELSALHGGNECVPFAR